VVVVEAVEEEVEEEPTVVEQIREAVHFPAWLMSVVDEHDLGDLTVSEIWGRR
jgi:hypothetical protein